MIGNFLLELANYNDMIFLISFFGSIITFLLHLRFRKPYPDILDREKEERFNNCTVIILTGSMMTYVVFQHNKMLKLAFVLLLLLFFLSNIFRLLNLLYDEE